MNALPDRIPLESLRLYYSGSVQKLYTVPGRDDVLISETTAGGSVFDVGTIFNIEGSDTGRAGFRHLVFQELRNPGSWKTLSERLRAKDGFLQTDASGTAERVFSDFCSKGAMTHHVGMVDPDTGKVYTEGFPPRPGNMTLIKRYDVLKPDLVKVMKGYFYDYVKYHRQDRYVIPLEYIVRIGMTSGSSILRKYNALGEPDRKAFLRELGLDRPLSPWTTFTHPIIDLTTKYEPEDRNISRQEAALMSGIDGGLFSRSLIMALLGAYLVQKIFSRMGLALWDLKWEIAVDGNDLVFVDTIDTDSVRVTVNVVHEGVTYFVHFNKQAMRDYYKLMHAGWYEAVNEAKKAASKSGRAFTDILKEGQRDLRYPDTPEVDTAFLDIQREKFSMIQDYMQNSDTNRDLRKEAERIAKAEVEYYVKYGKIDDFRALNAVGG